MLLRLAEGTAVTGVNVVAAIDGDSVGREELGANDGDSEISTDGVSEDSNDGIVEGVYVGSLVGLSVTV